MRNWLLVLFAVLLGISCKPDKDAFIIQGKIEGLKTPYVYLIHPQETGEKIDTLEVKNGVFRIKGKVTNPNVYLLAFGPDYMPLEIMLEPGKFEVSGKIEDADTWRVEGGQLQKTYNRYMDLMIPYNDRYTELYNQLTTAKLEGNAEEVENLSGQLDSIKDIYYEKSYQFVEEQPVSILSAKLISEILMSNPDVNRLQPVIDKFDDHVRQSSFGQRIITTMTTIQKTAVGTVAPLFTMNDLEGNQISLEKYKGKYVLVDFWASWCGPCRDENPRIVGIFNKFKGPKFDILGVSIDQNREKWKEAVVADQLAWTQVIDDSNVANKEYGVVAIPANVLVDPQGVIVAKNLFGRKLEQKLAEVLNK